MSAQKVGLLVFVFVLFLNTSGVFLDFVLIVCRLKPITHYAWEHKWISFLIVAFNIIGVEGLMIHFLFPPKNKERVMRTSGCLYPHQATLSDLQSWLAGDLGSAVARLYAVDTPFDPTNTPADYVEASFPGYVPVLTIPWGTPSIDANGKASVSASGLSYSLHSTAGSYPAYGVYLTDVAQTILLAVCPFGGGIAFTPQSPDHSFAITVTVDSELKV